MLKDIEAVLKLNTALFEQGLGRATQQVKGFERTLNSGFKGVENLGKSLTDIGTKAAVGFAGLSAAIAGVSKVSAEFEKGMTLAGVALDVTTSQMEQLKAETLSLAQKTPVALNDLSRSLYDIAGAGIPAAEAMGTLESSSQLAVVGVATVTESTDLMTSALNSFKAEGLSASETANILYKAVDKGKMTVAQMSEAFGANAQSMVAAEVKLRDYASATAALTAQGMPAAVAQTQLKSAITSMLDPSKEMAIIFDRLGVTSAKQLIQQSGSMGAAFAKIRAEAEAMGIPLTKVVGRVEAFNAMIALSGSAAGTYESALQALSTSSNDLQAAYDKMSKTFSFVMGQLGNSLSVLAVQIGDAMAPALSKLAQGLTTVVNWFTALPQPMKELIANSILAAAAVTGIVAAFGLIVGPIMTGVGAIGQFVMAAKTVSIVPQIIGAVRIAMVALGGSIPIIGQIGLAIGALALAWDTNFLNIRGIIGAAYTWIKQNLDKIGSALLASAGPLGQLLRFTVENWGKIKEVYTESAKSIKENQEEVKSTLLSLLGPLGQLQAGWRRHGQEVVSTVKMMANALGVAIKNTIQFVTNVVVAGLNGINILTQNGINFVQKIISGGLRVIEGYFPGFSGQVSSLMSGISSRVSSSVSGIISNVKNACDQMLSLINDVLAKLGLAQATVNSGIRQMSGQVDSFTAGAISQIRRVGSELASIGQGAYNTSGLSKLVNTYTGAFNKYTAQRKALAQPMKLGGATPAAGGGGGGGGGGRKKSGGGGGSSSSVKSIGDEALSSATDAYTEALARNEQQLDLNKAKLSEYQGQSADLALELQKLKDDQMALVQAEKDLTAVRTAGSADKKKADELKQVRSEMQANLAEQQRVELQLTKVKQEEALKRKELATNFRLQELAASNEIADQQANFEAQKLKEQLDAKKITQQQYNEQLLAIKTAQHEREKALLDQELALTQERYNTMLAIQGQEFASSEQGYQMRLQMLELQKQLNLAQGEYNNQLSLLAGGQQAQAATGQQAGGIFQTIGGTFQQMVSGVIQGNLDMANSFKQLAASLVGNLVNGAFKTVLSGFTSTMQGTQSTAQSAFGVVQNGFFSMIGGFLTKLGIFKATSIAASKSTALSQASANAAAVKGYTATAAMASYAAMAGIPVIGPTLGKIEAGIAKAYGAGMAVAARASASLASFAVGTPEVNRDMVAQIHKGEMIIPSTFSSAIRAGQLSLSGPAGSSGSGDIQVHLHQEGALIMGQNSLEIATEIEKLLKSKSRIVGSNVLGLA